MSFNLPQVVEVGQVWEVKIGYFVDEHAPRNRLIVAKVISGEDLLYPRMWVELLDLVGKRHNMILDTLKLHYKRIA